MPRSRSCSRTVLLLSWSICLLSAELFRGVLARPHHRRHKEKSPAPNGSPLSLPSSSPLSLSDSNHHVSQKRLKHARINAIKKDMLDKLGMRNAPDVSRFNTTVEESRRMLRLYKKGLEDRQGTAAHKLLEEDLEYYAKTFNSFSYEGGVPAASQPDAWYSGDGFRLYFKVDIPLPADARRETLVPSATLKMYKLAVRPSNLKDKSLLHRSVRVDIYQLLEPVVSGRVTLRKLVDSRMVALDRPGWESFSVAEAVQDWVDNPSSNHGLEISSHDQPLCELVDFSVAPASENEVRSPSIDIYSQERSILGRKKRSEDREDCVQGDGETKCCRFPLEINFKEIGWNWVLAPDTYQAYYCDGLCPHRYKTAHAFAAIKSLLHLNDPATVPAPCCTATEFQSFSILHYDENGEQKVKTLDNMVVKECRCA